MIRAALAADWKRAQVTADRTRGRIEAVLDWAAVHTGRTGAPNPARWKGNLQHLLRDTAKVKHHDKPPRMRWATYNQLMDRLVAADGIADERLTSARTQQGCCAGLPMLAAVLVAQRAAVQSAVPGRTRTQKRHRKISL
jgi:Phage integrase central domain